jgi:glutathione S-transferase
VLPLRCLPGSKADILLGAVAQRWFALDVACPALPALTAWYQLLREHPTFAQRVDLPLT